MTLKEYQSKRRSGRSPEPHGRRRKRGARKEPHFVIQHHAASTDHYDFRLEIDGVLASWAVPKGPSTNPRDKRMARRTEDHPMEYETFEGVIPEGEYGAGSVIVWDRGTYSNDSEHDMAEALKRGHLSFRLDGEKVATPLEWDELDSRGMRPDRFTIRDVPKRLAGQRDPWADIGRRARALSRPTQRLSKLRGSDA
jgi:DNA ligase D-like protein (predicted 3'-phosphoesterase)